MLLPVLSSHGKGAETLEACVGITLTTSRLEQWAASSNPRSLPFATGSRVDEMIKGSAQDALQRRISPLRRGHLEPLGF